jgi:hypothetical protein
MSSVRPITNISVCAERVVRRRTKHWRFSNPISQSDELAGGEVINNYAVELDFKVQSRFKGLKRGGYMVIDMHDEA